MKIDNEIWNLIWNSRFIKCNISYIMKHVTETIGFIRLTEEVEVSRKG